MGDRVPVTVRWILFSVLTVLGGTLLIWTLRGSPGSASQPLARSAESTGSSAEVTRVEDVRAELRDLAFRGGLALLSILGVLTALLGGLRPAATVLASAAAAVALALLLMAPLGLTLNLVTLAGLSLLVGLLVDNAAVMVSQIRDELRRGGSGSSPDYTVVARRAVAAVGLPLLGCTATTTAVFLPMVYLSGDLRDLFLPFAVLAGATLASHC